MNTVSDTSKIEREEAGPHDYGGHGEAGSGHRHMGHGFLMFVVCGVMLLAVLMIAWVGDGRFGYASIFVLLLCPILHMVLHRGHGRHHESRTST